MNKYLLIFLTLLVMIFGSCKDIEVHYPIPLQSQLELIIIATAEGREVTVQFDANDLASELVDELKEAGFSMNDVEKIVLEGAAYILVETSNSEAVVNDSLNISYDDPEFINIMYLDQLNLGQALNIPQTDLLTPSGVSLFNSILNDIKNNRTLPAIFIQSKSSLLAGGTEAIFKVQLDLTITTVVKRIQTIFDPLG
jgi:ABC-type amino acid transport substrate-binding protein